MILYFTPGACSLAGHIALHEAGLPFDLTRVDLSAHTTEHGRDYMSINPKGYVPALAFDDGQLLTENIAILSWVADRAPRLALHGDMGRYRLLEALAYVSTELHKSFKPYFNPSASDAEKDAAGKYAFRRFGFLAERLRGGYLFGPGFSVADAYLFVTLRWAKQFDLSVPEPLPAYLDRVTARPPVHAALGYEGLS